MTIKIGGILFNQYNNLKLTSRYDSLVSDFSMNVTCDPNNTQHRQLFKPFARPTCVISYGNTRIFTGIVLNGTYSDEAEPTQIAISGYCKTGVLENADIPANEPLQFDNLSLKDITEKLIKPFGLSLVIDDVVSKEVNATYDTQQVKEDMTIKEYLSTLASQKHVILTHDEYGNLLYTKVKIGKASEETTTTLRIKGDDFITKEFVEETTFRNYKPVFNFVGGMPGVKMRLNTNGQEMHSTITIQKQADETDNASEATVTNPYGPAICPRVNRQSSGRAVDTPNAARNALAIEIKNIGISIEMQGWLLNGGIVKRNTLVTIKSEKLFLFKPTSFFIESVTYEQSAQTTEGVATLTCVLPDVYNTETTVTNVFS